MVAAGRREVGWGEEIACERDGAETLGGIPRARSLSRSVMAGKDFLAAPIRGVCELRNERTE